MNLWNTEKRAWLTPLKGKEIEAKMGHVCKF